MPGRTGALALAILFAAATAAAAQATSADVARLAQSGSIALQEKRYADALESFTAAGRLAPRNAQIAFGAGISAYMLGQSALAERQLLRALDLDPAITDASLLLGEIQYTSGRVQDAVAREPAKVKSIAR